MPSFDTLIINGSLIDGSGAPIPGQATVTFDGTETEDCIFRGFRVQSGAGNFSMTGSTGGGIDGNGTKATIESNIITGNIAGKGGGIFDADGLLFNNAIVGNLSEEGGGLHSCDGRIYNNIIVSNDTSVGDGGGLKDCMGDIRNNIIYFNDVATGASDPQISNSATPNYCDIEGFNTAIGTGNINANPQFVNANAGDFHLQGGSPCVDAGQFVQGVVQDAEGEVRPLDGRGDGFGATGDGSDVDIGIDEVTGLQTALPLPSIPTWSTTR